MRMNKLSLALAASIAFTSTATFAGETYMTFGAATLNYKEEAYGLKATANPYAAGLGIGANLFPHIDVEGMMVVGLDEADVDISGISGFEGDLNLDYAAGVYGLVRSDENHTGSVYLKAGFTKVNGSGKVTNGSQSEKFDFDETGFSYGAGIDFTYNEESAIRLEYMNYYDKNDIRIDGFSLSFKTSLPL